MRQMVVVRSSLLQGLSIVLTCLGPVHEALATEESDFDPQTLAQALDPASYVVRGRPVSSRVDIAGPGERFQDVQFEITEVIKGSVSASQIVVRQPAPPEGSDFDGVPGNDINDVILALGARSPVDGSYGAAPGFSNGEYRVESDQDGDWVLVNALGVDADSVTPKDVHRKDANGRIPIEVFRRIAKGTDPPVEASPGVKAQGPLRPRPASNLLPSEDLRSHGVAQPSPALPVVRESDNRLRWMAIAVAFGAIAIVVGVYLTRTSTSRRK